MRTSSTAPSNLPSHLGPTSCCSLKIKKQEDWRKTRGSELSRVILEKISPSDLESVKNWEATALKEITKQSSRRFSTSIKLLFDASEYYESIGHIQSAINVVGKLLETATKTGNTRLQRRAHSVLSAYCSRACDFNAAFKHAEQANKLSRELKDNICSLSSLLNTALVLDAAGLISNARSVALNASLLPSRCELSAWIHLISANNAIKYCHKIGDVDTAEYFFKISSGYSNANPKLFSGITKALIDSSTAEHLIVKGKAEQAVAGLEKTLATIGRKNSRTTVLLDCALASGYLSLEDFNRLSDCEARLEKMLLTDLLPADHDDVVRILIRIAEKTNNKRKKLKFERRLQEHIIITRHSQFFEAICRNYAIDESFAANLKDPKYSAPQWMSDISGCEVDCTDLHHNPLGVLERRSAQSHPSARLQEYLVAEDWAVAAEFYSGGNWMHSFCVGELVRLMALQMHIASSQATQMGLAARLHDIGKIATVPASFTQVGAVPLNEFASTRRHAEIGGALLASSSEPLLRLAGQIALAHHEWWNGFGFPNGLRGEKIPLEARLCAVADTFIGLMKPRSGDRWATEVAVEQMLSMAGVQLDPNLVHLLLCVVQASDVTKEPFLEQQGGMKQNRLLRAKTELFAILELSE